MSFKDWLYYRIFTKHFLFYTLINAVGYFLLLLSFVVLDVPADLPGYRMVIGIALFFLTMHVFRKADRHFSDHQ